jgi:hypothetical protein
MFTDSLYVFPAAQPASVVTVVMNLATEKKQAYDTDPRKAVIAAHAQSLNDWNTWQYEQRYGHLVQKARHVVTCGDWSAFHCSCHALTMDGPA